MKKLIKKIVFYVSITILCSLYNFNFGQNINKDSLFCATLNEIICETQNSFLIELKEKYELDTIDFLTVLEINKLDLKTKTAEFTIRDILSRDDLDRLYPRKCFKCDGHVSIINNSFNFSGLKYIAIEEIDVNTAKYIYSYYPIIKGAIVCGETFKYTVKVKNKRMKSLKKYY